MITLRKDGTFLLEGVTHDAADLFQYLDFPVQLAEGFILYDLFVILASDPERWGAVVGNSAESIRKWFQGIDLPSPGFGDDDDPLLRVEVCYVWTTGLKVGKKRTRDSARWDCSGVSESEHYGLSFAGPVRIKDLPLVIADHGTKYSWESGTQVVTQFPKQCTLREFVNTVWEETCGYEDPLEAALDFNTTLDRLETIERNGSSEGS